MAIEDWRKPRERMEREALEALAVLIAGSPPPQDAARRTILAAHQVPELVELGAFAPGDLDDEALAAMAVVVDIAAGWDDAAEAIDDYVQALEPEELERLHRAARPWAQAVWTQMVRLEAAEKQARLDALRRG